ncbi:MAG: hypothetical protein NZ517_03715, partial [Candidatus Nitrosocaldus sp.]|nr:hypothetical protein [Candidatus Nitrosocaldus sp.]
MNRVFARSATQIQSSNNKDYRGSNNSSDNTSLIKPRYNIITIERLELFNTAIYAAIVDDASAKGGKRYILIEPTLTSRDVKNLAFIKQVIIDELLIDMSMVQRSTKKEMEDKLSYELETIAKKYDLHVNRSFNKLRYYLIRDLLYLGKIEPLMHDHMIEEVNCDGPNIPLYIWHREHESLPTNIVFSDEELNSMVIKMAYLAGKHISL